MVMISRRKLHFHRKSHHRSVLITVRRCRGGASVVFRPFEFPAVFVETVNQFIRLRHLEVEKFRSLLPRSKKF